MTVYARARLHALRVWTVLAGAILFVLLVDWFVGHSVLAFAAAIVALLIANYGILAFDCPRCGSNLFFRGVLVVPWPNRTCSRCGLDLTRQPG